MSRFAGVKRLAFIGRQPLNALPTATPARWTEFAPEGTRRGHGFVPRFTYTSDGPHNVWRRKSRHAQLTHPTALRGKLPLPR